MITFNLFEKTLSAKGIPVSSAYSKILELNALSASQFQELREEQKWMIVRHHFNNNNFYRQVANNKLPQNWNEVPLMQKKDFQKDLSKVLADGYSTKNVYIGNTSGSSGHPFFYAKDTFCHALSWAVIKHRYALHSLDYGAKQARFYGIPKSGIEFYKETLKDMLANRVRFPVFDLSDNVLDEFTNRFKSTPFEVIYGYTSSIVLYARHLLKKGILLKNICPTLKGCIVTSEVCVPEDKLLLEQAFGIRVINEYGASELGVISFEDNDGDWITSDENLYIEVLDDNNMPVPPGTEGKLVITSLYNWAMPLIRYEIGDAGALDEPRKGNWHTIKKLSGRINDFAHLPSGKKSAGMTFYYISKSLLESGSIIREFIVRQKSIELFHYEYAAERDLNREEQEQVIKLMDEYLEPGLEATFERVDKIERPASGKTKHFYNELPKKDL